jgi:hypothetical protein
MSGWRLIVGVIAMAIIVPAVIFYFLDLTTARQFAAIAIPSFFGWCVAEFLANILARPRLEHRSAKDAFREWDQQTRDRAVSSSDPSPKA